MEFINVYFLHPQLQNELDRIAEEWNAHPISKRQLSIWSSPSYNAPDLYGTRYFVHPVPQKEVLFCKEEETDQNVYPCDQALFELCCIVMEENNIAAPEDLYQANDQYINLRNNLLELIILPWSYFSSDTKSAGL